MTGLAEWLLEQIADDERVARAADPGSWEVHQMLPRPDLYRVIASTVNRVSCESFDAHNPAHIARWDPARVLAECEAKRKLVEFWSQAYQSPADADRFAGPDWDRVRAGAAWTLRKLALPYADRPGYREGWRP